MANKLLVVIGGPTGAGKTDVAIHIAQHFNTEIINADSRQVYKELNVGVGKPSSSQLATVPHHLIGHVHVTSPYSAGHYTTDALTILYTLFARHDIVVLAGGTGLYIKSVVEGFDEMPQVPEKITNHWTKMWEKEGIEPLLRVLEEKDPDYLAVVDQSNHARLIRALSVSDYTGKPFSSFRLGSPANRSFQSVGFALERPRIELYERIDQRVLEMVKSGWVEEAKSLYEYRNLKALQTVGYKELFEVIEGNMTLASAIPKIQQSTRQYAKRQLTWLRHQGSWEHIHPDEVQKIIMMIEAKKSAWSI